MISRTIDSSTIVLTSTHFSSERLETVGFCIAGSRLSTFISSLLGTFIPKFTFPSAAMAPRSISAMSSIFCFFHGSA